jgi:1-acyl-sn-glycerol-3-phosphate acyltransferase
VTSMEECPRYHAQTARKPQARRFSLTRQAGILRRVTISEGMSRSPLVYLRLLYRMPTLVLVTLGCLGFARLTGRRRMAYRVWAILHGRLCGRRVVISGAERDPSAQLIIANHTGYPDVVPMANLWPDARPIATHTIRSWFVLGALSDTVAIFVDDGSAESRRQAREEMRRVWEKGEAVIVFPEGAASHGGEARGPGRFRVGPFEEAAARAITIQGVRIDYPPELVAALDGRRFEERFFWVLCQNFTIRARVFPSERVVSDAETLRRTWEERLL